MRSSASSSTAYPRSTNATFISRDSAWTIAFSLSSDAALDLLRMHVPGGLWRDERR